MTKLAHVTGVTVHTWREWAAARLDWERLVDSSPYTSLFHSPPWIEAWLEVYGPQLRPQILVVRHGSETIAACLLVSRRQRRGPVPLRRIYLNACGEDEAEETALEFNDLLCLSGFEQTAAEAVRRHSDAQGWDEFFVPGCCRSSASLALKRAFADVALETQTSPSFFVDLEQLRVSGAPVEGALSQKNRYNIRQSLRLLESSGGLRLERVTSVDEARAHLHALAALHQQSWRNRGAPGAFHSPRFMSFHERFVERAFPLGFVEMTALRCGEELIGALYCVGWRGTLYFYQCGFRYSDNKRIRPGLCTLLLSIQSFAAEGKWREFDLMAGDSEYKRVFSKRYRELDWMTFRRPTVPVRLIGALQRVRQAWRGWSSRRSPS